MKSFTVLTTDEANPEKFIGYMVPKPEEVYFARYHFRIMLSKMI